MIENLGSSSNFRKENPFLSDSSLTKNSERKEGAQKINRNTISSIPKTVKVNTWRKTRVFTIEESKQNVISTDNYFKTSRKVKGIL